MAEITDDVFMDKPDKTVSAKAVFGVDLDIEIPAFSKANSYVPPIDEAYRFDPETTMAILAGFARNRRVMVQGYHGTGKSTHIEQVAARLNWPCIRVNLDSHVSRIDLIGKDAIVVENGVQVTAFKEGMLPWAFQRPVALVFDEYDAGRPDVMFVIQRVLEAEGRLTLLDQNKVLTPNPWFRLFATTNTIGLGDTTGLYHGTQQINQGQMDRWSIVTTLNYLAHDEEAAIVIAKVPLYNSKEGRQAIDAMRRYLDSHEPADRHYLGAKRRDLQEYRLRVPRDLPQQVRRARTPDRGRVLSARLWRGSAGGRAASKRGLNGDHVKNCAADWRYSRVRSDIASKSRSAWQNDRSRKKARTLCCVRAFSISP